MATSKLPNIGAKQVGQNLNVKVGEGDELEVITIKGDKETLTPIKDKIKEYLTKKSTKLHKEIMALIKPKTTKDKVDKEKKELAVKAEIKSLKNKAKATPVTKAKGSSKEKAKSKLKVTEEEHKEIAQKVEEELPRHKRYKGYKHPVTGKTWNGEKYV